MDQNWTNQNEIFQLSVVYMGPLEWDKVKITSDKPSYSQFNPVWIFPPFLDGEIRQQMHHCGKFLDFVWFHFLNAWK